MLSLVGLVDQWRLIESELPEGWSDARLRLTFSDPARAERASALLAPAAPARRGREVRFFSARRGAGPSPEAVRRMLRRLDAERLDGELELLAAGEPVAEPVTPRATLAGAWESELAALPADWSDVYAEVELTSTDHLDGAALLLSPLNPSRFGGKPALRFRAAKHFGYGASPEMVRSSLAHLDERGVRGVLTILRALSDTLPVATQGPVWYVGGKAV
jgi:hypothetical protein